MKNIGRNIEKIIQNEIEKGTFPGAVVKVVEGRRTILNLAMGNRAAYPKDTPSQSAQIPKDTPGQSAPIDEKHSANLPERVSGPMTTDTIFDLASLTKPLATALLSHIIFARENIPLDTPISYFFDCKDHPASIGPNPKTCGITLFQLLTHTSGLPPVPGIFNHFNDPSVLKRIDRIDRESAIRFLFQVTPVEKPGKEIIYSCTGYIFLGLILEKLRGARLSDIFKNIITGPLGIEDLMFRPPKSNLPRIAPTEFCRWRKRWIHGEVHDENSYCLGGDAGNAGLFGTADAIRKILDIYLNEAYLYEKSILSPKMAKLATSIAISKHGINRSTAFLFQGKDAPCGPYFGRESFGHTGFTGTSIWIDPSRNLKIIILTNRVHMGREKTADAIKDFRTRIHSEIYKNLY